MIGVDSGAFVLLYLQVPICRYRITDSAAFPHHMMKGTAQEVSTQLIIELLALTFGTNSAEQGDVWHGRVTGESDKKNSCSIIVSRGPSHHTLNGCCTRSYCKHRIRDCRWKWSKILDKMFKQVSLHLREVLAMEDRPYNLR